MGRHYPDLQADPVRQPGYYYSRKYTKLARLRPGDKLPRHMAPWEFVARDDEGTSSEVLQRLKEMHPDLDPYRLTFTTTTPVDMRHMERTRQARTLTYVLVAAGALALGLWIARRTSRDED